MITDSIFKNNILLGKNIIFAGGSSGIGAESAKLAANLGANVILIARNDKNLIKVKNSLKTKKNQSHEAIICDLSNFDFVSEIFSKIRLNHGLIDGIVWTAGEEIIKQPRATKIDDINKAFGASIFGLLGASKTFSSKRFWNQGCSSIILISSVASIKPNYGMTFYSASKASISGIMKSMSVDLSKYNTRVNSLILGAIKTEMHNRITSRMNEEMINSYEKKHLFGFGQTKDISPMIIYLLSDASKWITGSEFVLDGGYLLS